MAKRVSAVVVSSHVCIYKSVSALFDQGMAFTVLFTTIPDLRVRLRTDAEHLSYALAFGMIGPMIAGPSASVVDRWVTCGARQFNTFYILCHKELAYIGSTSSLT